MVGKRRADPTPPAAWLPWALLVAVLAVVVVGYLLSRGAAATQTDNSVLTEQRDATAEQALQASGPVVDLCDDASPVGEALRAEPRDPCALARQVQASPIAGPRGPVGATGGEGRGIVGTSISGGMLLVTYTDGQTETLGTVVGARGAAGLDGRGIVDSTIEAGRLVLTFTDGTRLDVGQVVGAAGADGADAVDGRGVESVDQVGGRLIVTYTDGATQDAGPVPVAEPGVQGVGVREVRAEERDGQCALVFVLVDPSTDTTAEQVVPVSEQVCAAGPIDLDSEGI